MPVVYGGNYHYLKKTEQPTTFVCDDCGTVLDVKQQQLFVTNWHNVRKTFHLCKTCHEAKSKPKHSYCQTTHKDCKKCGRSLPVDMFYKRVERKPDGRIYHRYSTSCKECTREQTTAKYHEQKIWFLHLKQRLANDAELNNQLKTFISLVVGE